MSTPPTTLAWIKRFLHTKGILVDRLSVVTSPDLRLVAMLANHEVDLVVDVGANTGGYARSLRSAGFAGRILSFEPLMSAHGALVAASRMDTNWAVADRMALGDRNGVVSINVAGNSASSSIREMLETHRCAAPESAYVGREDVDVRRLDDVRLPFLDSAARPFLKIDTQGYEAEVLEGAAGILDRVRGVQLELTLSPLYQGQLLWRDLVDRLEVAGFGLWGMVPEFIDPKTGRMLQCDGIFFRT
jgi:FkbM family methyltransferase